VDQTPHTTIDAVQRAARGDRAAQAALLRELQDSWFRLCLGMLGGDPEQARDATQETGLRFLQLLPRFRGESHVRTWSLGIAINVVREMRRRRSTGTPLDEEQLAATQRVAPEPSDEADRAEQQSRLREVLRDLPERQREAVLLRFFEDLSVEETASAMECAEGTVKATVHQALRALRQRLARPSTQGT
jgi:RNA polymerase sigma-70 factor (ECF subfamily)